MGLFSFLNRKHSGNHAPAFSLKGQAYESTTASQPPVRGTYPVAGNGANVLDKLQQAARKRSLGQLQLVRNGSVISVSAPSPSVPRFPESSGGRPSSAPNGPRSSSRSKSLSRSSRGSSPGVGLRPDNDFVQKQVLPPVPPIPAQHRRRGSSLGSEQTSRFVDILDAQGEFRPSNFRSRVEATGARDYGEDVAERNMGENGHNLHSPAVQAFYAHSSLSSPRAAEVSPSAKAAKPTHTNGHRSNRQRNPGKRDVSTSLTKASDASAWIPFLDTNEVELKGSDHSRGRRSERGRAKRHEMRSTNALGVDQRSPVAGRRKSFHASASPPSKEKLKPRPLSLHHSFSSFNDQELLPPMPRSHTTNSDISAAHGIGRLEVEPLADETFDEPAPSPHIPGRSKTIRHTSSARSDMQSEWQAQSRQTRSEKSHISRPSSSSSLDPSRPRTRSIGVSSVDQRPRLDDITEHIPVRTSSLGLQSQPCFTPTTTTSGYSSNPFPRPGSQHTPTTSIDASLLAPSENLGFERDLGISNLSSGDYPSPIHYNIPEDEYSLDIPVSRKNRDRDHYQTPFGNNRDLVSQKFSTLDHDIAGSTDDSDVDSFVGFTGRDSPHEEGLLFDEGIYNGTGGALPGLFDSFAIPNVPASLGRPKTAKPTTGGPRSPPRQYLDHHHPKTRSSHSKHHPRSHRRDDSHGLTFNEEEFASFLELEDELLRKAGLMRISDYENENRRPRRALYEYEEEGEAKVDLRTATRLKKDMRANTFSTTRSRQSRSTYRPRARDDDGNAADTED